MLENHKPIGFFDSGVGGISVLKTAYDRMPHEDYIYYGDSLNAPYGEKTEEQIKQLSLAAGAFLFDKGVKAIVMACNTATSASVIRMREKYNIPVISMEPAVKPALEVCKDGRVLVLATPATISQARYLGLIERLEAHDKVINVGCSGLVELIEAGQTDEKSIHDYLSKQLLFLNDQPVCAVVLGCTHYAFVEARIKSYMDMLTKKDCPIFDGRHGTARQLERVLDERGIRHDKTEPGHVDFYTSSPDILPSAYKGLFDNFNS